jgi:hypothetical protein
MSALREAMNEASRQSLVAGLAENLSDVAWGSEAMSVVINQYLWGLTRTTAAGIAARVSGLFDLGLDAAGSPQAALQLAALQGLTNEAWEDTVRDAWESANDTSAPPGQGYIHFRGEVILDTLRRIKPKRNTP